MGGRKYRAPVALATCFTEHQALVFAQRKAAPAAGRPPILWTVRLDPQSKSFHGYMLEPNSEGRSERELLFAPYACFRVERANWQQQASAEVPHHIQLFAYPNVD